ncbi:MAG: FAD-binding protein [Nitrososphaerales archaeon]
MTEAATGKEGKISRRQFMGTAAAGAVVLGAVAGAKSFAPTITVGGEKLPIPVATQPRSSGGSRESPMMTPSQTTGIPSTWDYSADVVVVGDGGAGECAAIAAYDAGSSVLILEKAPKGLDGGNTGCCGGFSIITPLTDFITLVNMLCYGTTPLPVVTAYCTELTNIGTWLTGLGATMNQFAFAPPNQVPQSFFAPYTSPDIAALDGSISVPAFSYPTKFLATGAPGNGNDLWAFLDNCRATRGIPILYQTPATQLIQNPTTNEILGVVATNWTGQSINVRANKAVILACGGNENNPWIAANFFSDVPKSETLCFQGTPYNTGDGLAMSQAVGAKLWHMNRKENLYLACKAGSLEVGVGLPLQGTNDIGYGVSAATTVPIIHVNRYGNRFYNEWTFPQPHSLQSVAYTNYQMTTKAVDGLDNPPLAQADLSDWPNMPMYAIFDSKAMKNGSFYQPPGGAVGYNAIHKLYNWSADNTKELANGWIITADTPQDLGAKITCRDFFGAVVGMNAAGLAAQVTQWNSMCAAGVDTQFGRPKSTLQPLTNPPYYAMELTECLINTGGGPAHDEYSRTLDVWDNPIPRLYDAGEVGSIWGYCYYGGVGEACAFGKIAGEQAATLPSWT